ncbi:hypothetical protein [Williamsia sp. DF01-3]|nr:hypothetical protein [Williamsia sp. DF01-3]MCK0517124.1 hypothetical protein [Williamsia sp. DF01-3]
MSEKPPRTLELVGDVDAGACVDGVCTLPVPDESAAQAPTQDGRDTQ